MARSVDRFHQIHSLVQVLRLVASEEVLVGPIINFVIDFDKLEFDSKLQSMLSFHFFNFTLLVVGVVFFLSTSFFVFLGWFQIAHLWFGAKMSRIVANPSK